MDSYNHTVNDDDATRIMSVSELWMLNESTPKNRIRLNKTRKQLNDTGLPIFENEFSIAVAHG